MLLLTTVINSIFHMSVWVSVCFCAILFSIFIRLINVQTNCHWFSISIMFQLLPIETSNTCMKAHMHACMYLWLLIIWKHTSIIIQCLIKSSQFLEKVALKSMCINVCWIQQQFHSNEATKNVWMYTIHCLVHMKCRCSDIISHYHIKQLISMSYIHLFDKKMSAILLLILK